MGTSWHVSCVSDATIAPQLDAVISKALDEVDQAMSTYKPDSEISRFSKSSTGITVSAPSFYVISVALDIAKQTNGAFDPTVMPLVDMWGFGPEANSPSAPTDAAIASAMEICGWQHLQLSNDSFFVGKDITELEIDLSAIAKGFGADNVASALEASGVSNYMIEVGGEVRVRGNSGKQRPWRLAIDSPNAKNYARVIELTSGAIATSGDYRNMRIVDGELVSHTIDPTTGRPITHNLASVSIVAQNCTIADAMATACMVLGADAGLELIERTADAEAYFITRISESAFITSQSSGFPEELNLD